MSPTTKCLRRVRNTQKSRIASMASSMSGSSFREHESDSPHECKTWTPVCKSDVCMPAIETSSKSSSSSAGKSWKPV